MDWKNLLFYPHLTLNKSHIQSHIPLLLSLILTLSQLYRQYMMDMPLHRKSILPYPNNLNLLILVGNNPYTNLYNYSMLMCLGLDKYWKFVVILAILLSILYYYYHTTIWCIQVWINVSILVFIALSIDTYCYKYN